MYCVVNETNGNLYFKIARKQNITVVAHNVATFGLISQFVPLHHALQSLISLTNRQVKFLTYQSTSTSNTKTHYICMYV